MMRVIIFLAGLVALTACETVGGFGQDVENAGETIEDTAADVEAGL